MSANTIITSVVTAGSNNHSTVSEEANAYATDFVTQGVVGTLVLNSGSGGTGSFCVNQNTGSNLAINILAGQAYITATPSSQDSQVVRARASSDYTAYTINSNSSGSTKYDWVYLKVDPTKANNPAADASDVTSIYTSRSSSNTTDNGTPPTYGILLAVVTVANSATAITNGNITDKRTQATISGTGISGTSGWNTLPAALSYNANNGNKEFVLNTSIDTTGTLSPGMKLSVARSTTPSTQCMAFASGSSQYATKSSPSGITFTSAFTCEAWIYPTSYTGSNAGIVSRYDGTNGFTLYLTSSGQLALNGQSTTSQTSYQSVPINQFVHVAGTYSGGTMVLYINGTVAPSSKSGSGTSITQGGSLQVGAYNTGAYFNGYISEARVWSVAQSQANIQANMAINLTGSESNLVALFKGNGNFNDATSNANNLTATNSAIATQAANPFNAIEYANVRAVSSSTVTLYTGDAGTIPNQTLNSPQYSTVKEPYGLPEILNSKVLGKVIWCSGVTNTATATGTQMNGATMTMTMPTGGKWIVLRAYTNQLNTSAASAAAVLDGYIGSVQWSRAQNGITTFGNSALMQSAPFLAPAGQVTFSLDLWTTSAGTATFGGATTGPAYFTIEEA
jgi:hypothetical protein